METVIYPGTFDPVTLGHLDLIRRGARVFNHVIVAVGDNPAKKTLFSAAERVAVLRAETRSLNNVEVRRFTGLLVNFAKRRGVPAVMRGIRTVSDLEYELQMALTNRAVGKLETLFLTPSPEVQFLSAQLIREIASMGGDVTSFLTPAVAGKLEAKLGKPSRKPSATPRGARS